MSSDTAADTITAAASAVDQSNADQAPPAKRPLLEAAANAHSTAAAAADDASAGFVDSTNVFPAVTASDGAATGFGFGAAMPFTDAEPKGASEGFGAFTGADPLAAFTSASKAPTSFASFASVAAEGAGANALDSLGSSAAAAADGSSTQRSTAGHKRPRPADDAGSVMPRGAPAPASSWGDDGSSTWGDAQGGDAWVSWDTAAASGDGFGASSASAPAFGAGSGSAAEGAVPTAQPAATRSEAQEEEQEGKAAEDAAAEAAAAEAEAEAHNAALLAADAGSAPAVTFADADAVGKTGEEEELTLIRVRGRLYVSEKAEGAGEAASAEPATEGGSSGGAAEHGSGAAAAGGATKWRECGLGPFKVNVRCDLAPLLSEKLQSLATANGPPLPDDRIPSGPSARLVMRQETTSGGASTRLVLNAAMWPQMHVQRHPLQDRSITFVTLSQEAGERGDTVAPTVKKYLLRLSKAEEAAQLLAIIEEAKRVGY